MENSEGILFTLSNSVFVFVRDMKDKRDFLINRDETNNEVRAGLALAPT
jgi:hypothetical protein